MRKLVLALLIGAALTAPAPASAQGVIGSPQLPVISGPVIGTTKMPWPAFPADGGRPYESSTSVEGGRFWVAGAWEPASIVDGAVRTWRMVLCGQLQDARKDGDRVYADIQFKESSPPLTDPIGANPPHIVTRTQSFDNRHGYPTVIHGCARSNPEIFPADASGFFRIINRAVRFKVCRERDYWFDPCSDWKIVQVYAPGDVHTPWQW